MTTQSDSSRSHIRWLIFAILACSYVLVYFHRLCTSALAVDLMRDLQADGSLMGLLAAAYFYPYAVMQLPAGLLSDSWGPRKTISVFFMVAFAGSLLLGLAPTVSWAIAGRTLVGVGMAMLFVPTLKVLAQWFKPTEFATMTGLLLAMGGLGSLAAAAPLVWLSNRLGWRQVFVLIGLLTLVLAVLVALLVRNRPPNISADDSPSSKASGPGLRQLYRGMTQVLSCRYFWPIALWFFFDFAVFFTIGGLWGGPYLMHVYHMNQEQVGRILSMMALGLVAGGPLLSWLSDRVLGRRKPVLVMTASGMVLITGMLVFTTYLPVWGLYVLYCAITFCGNGCSVIGFSMNKELFPIPIAGTATGLVNLFPFVAASLFQPLVGYLLDHGPKTAEGYSAAAYQHAFMVLFVCACLALAAALFTKETLKNN